MKYLFLIFILFLVNLVYGQIETGYHTKVMSMSGAGVAMEGIDSYSLNQAGITVLDNYGISLSSQNRFGIAELTEVTITGAKRIDSFGSVGLIISSFGLQEYKQQKYGLSYARFLSPKLTVGVQFDYFLTRIEGFGIRGNFTFEGGLQFKVSDQIRIGGHTINPLGVVSGSTFSDYELYQVGLAYIPSESLYIYTDISRKGVINSMHIGIDYEIIIALNIRLGVQSNPSSFGVGVRYTLNKNVSFDGAISSHEFLGQTPSFSLNYLN